MRPVLVLLLLTASCSRRDEVRPDPVVVKPVVPPAPKPAARERRLVAGVVVDLTERKILHTLSKVPPTFEELDASSAFLVDRAGEVHAFDLETGAERWHHKPAHCTAFTATSQQVYCVDGTMVWALSKKDGAPRALTGGGAIQQLLGVGSRLVLLRSGGTLESWPEGGTAAAATATSGFHTWPRLRLHHDGFCGATTVGGGVFAACYDAELTPRWSSTFTLSKPGEPPTSWFPRAIGPEFLVVSSWFGTGPDRALVARLGDGKELTRVEEAIGDVFSHDGKTLDGLLPAKGALRLLDPSGKALWTAKPRAEDCAETTSLDGRMFVAVHSSIAAGTVLHAFDATGTPAWSASPTLPPIAHSAYSNQVELSVAHGAVVMHGEEAAVEYLSLFEPKTGKILFEVVRPLW